MGRPWQQKKSNFDKLHEEMNKDNFSGYRAMMADLLLWDIPDNWDIRDIPMTKALAEQKVYSMKPLRKFFHEALAKQELSFLTPGDAHWSDGPVRFFMTDFRDMFSQYCKNNDIKSGGAGRSSLLLLKGELKELFPSAKVDLRMRVPGDMADSIAADALGEAMGCELPDIFTCAKEFEHTSGLPIGSLGIKGKPHASREWG
jgi:hypothetical protein